MRRGNKLKPICSPLRSNLNMWLQHRIPICTSWTRTFGRTWGLTRSLSFWQHCKRLSRWWPLRGGWKRCTVPWATHSVTFMMMVSMFYKPPYGVGFWPSPIWFYPEVIVGPSLSCKTCPIRWCKKLTRPFWIMNLGTAEFCKKYAENYKASSEAERVHCWQIL